MTRAGKCDTCRQRKVRCDEVKPKCGACKKKDRPCAYTFGNISALVLEDPNQYSGHGKAKVAPRIVPLLPRNGRLKATRAEECDADLSEGEGSLTQNRSSASAGTASLQVSRTLRSSNVLVPGILQMPHSQDTVLAARYIYVMEAQYGGFNPISIDGFWIGHVPSRIGTSPVLDRAIEFMLDSFATHWDSSHGKQIAARMSKGRALKVLREALSNGEDGARDDVVIASMLHFAAEIYMGVDNVDWVLHVLGVSKMLTQGNVERLDTDLLWSLVDGLYVDEVSEAMLEGRPSIYDTEFYLKYTYEAARQQADPSLTGLFDQLSRAIMHVLVQIPRLTCYVRLAIRKRDNPRYLQGAVHMAQQLWTSSPDELISIFISQTSTRIPLPPGPEIVDLIQDSFIFDTVQSLILVTKYFRFRVFLCGIMQRLYDEFDNPHFYLLSTLPNKDTVSSEDIKAATHLAQLLQPALSFSTSLQLVPLRILSSLQVSIGTWIRHIRRLHLSSQDSVLARPLDLNNTQRLRDWLVEATNRIQEIWRVPRADESAFEIVLDVATGGEIPAELQRRIQWEQWGVGESETSKAYDINVTTIQPNSEQSTSSRMGLLFRNISVVGKLAEDMQHDHGSGQHMDTMQGYCQKGTWWHASPWSGTLKWAYETESS